MKKSFYVILASIAVIIVIVFTVSLFINRKQSLSQRAGTEAPSLAPLYDKAAHLKAAGELLKAKGIYKELLEMPSDEEFKQKIQKELAQINISILFSPATTDDSTIYAVKKGDTLGRIAKRFDTTVELLMGSNNLKGDLIRAGDKLKVSTAKYSIIVDRSQNMLILKSDEDILKTYSVSTGMNGSTPVGTFKTVNKLKDPVWYKTGAVVPSGSPENILGSRWIGLSVAGYGIHGTTQPENIGKSITAGCIRMREPDIQELYAIVPIGTEVNIMD